MKYPNRNQAAVLFDARFDALDTVVRDFVRIAEMKYAISFKMPEQHPGAFYRLYTGGEDLMLTFEYVDAPPMGALFASALASPVTTMIAPQMPTHIENARSHILLEVCHGTLSPAEASPREAGVLHDTDMDLPSVHAAAFNRRLETLVLMARVLCDHIAPSAIHWTQSNQLFEPGTFETLASGGFPGPLTIHPLLFGEHSDRADGDRADGDLADGGDGADRDAAAMVGIRTFGARHWLGREILVPPSPLPWSAGYETILSFCAYATMEGGIIIPDGDTFGPPATSPDEESGEIWRVHHRDAETSLATNDDGDARGGPVALYELVPLRHDGWGYIAEDYARSANVLCERAPKPSDPDTDDATDDATDTDASISAHAAPGAMDPESTLAELKAALAEGRDEAAANNPPSVAPSIVPGIVPGIVPATPSRAGDKDISGRSLRARVFGKKDS